jgi:hypothetical protein
MKDLPPLPMTPHRFHVNVTQLGERMDYTATDMEQYARAALAAHLDKLGGK